MEVSPIHRVPQRPFTAHTQRQKKDLICIPGVRLAGPPLCSTASGFRPWEPPQSSCEKSGMTRAALEIRQIAANRKLTFPTSSSCRVRRIIHSALLWLQIRRWIALCSSGGDVMVSRTLLPVPGGAFLSDRPQPIRTLYCSPFLPPTAFVNQTFERGSRQ